MAISKKKKEVDIGYRIIKIHTTNFTSKDIDDKSLQNLFNSLNALGVNVNVSVNINREDSSITMDVATDLFNRETNVKLVEHSGRTVYFIQGLDQTYNKEKNAFDLPGPMLIHLYSIAYTHSRALLATEISPTCYHEKYFLPVIDPAILIQKNNVK